MSVGKLARYLVDDYQSGLSVRFAIDICLYEITIGFVLARDALETLDGKAARLAASRAPVALGLADALDEVDRTRLWSEMGFSGIAGYTLERASRTPRWGIDARALARRLRSLPGLREALVRREIGWSMAELVSRHATGETEEALLDEAKRLTVRQMRERLSMREPEEVPMRSVRTTVPLEDRCAFEATRMRVEAIAGRRLTIDDVMTALLGEGWITLIDLGVVPLETLEAEEERRELVRAWRRQVEAWQVEAEARCEPRIPAPPPADVDEQIVVEGESLDARVVRLSRRLAALDLELGIVLEELFCADGWRRLGYASARQYAQERIGLSHGSLKAFVVTVRSGADVSPRSWTVTTKSTGRRRSRRP